MPALLLFRRGFLERNGVPQSAMVEVEMPLFMQTQNNTGICWVVLDDVSPLFLSACCQRCGLEVDSSLEESHMR